LLKISDKLSVRFQKTGSGPPLLLIHTIRTQLEYFRSLAPLLARSHTVYAIDLPGHGHSPIDPSASFDEPYLRQAVIRFIEELNLSEVTIVGESIGGALALTVAASLPQSVKRVYAINPYDYEARYTAGATQFVVPARLEQSVAKACAAAAIAKPCLPEERLAM